MLLDLSGFRVVWCEENDAGGRRVVVMQLADEHGCPRCGVLVGGKPYDVRESPVKDLPMGQRPLTVVWRKRWYRCAEQHCPPGLLLWSIPLVCEAAALPCRACHFLLRIGTFPVAYALTFGCRFTGFEYGNSRTHRGWKQGGPRIFSRLMRKVEVPKCGF